MNLNELLTELGDDADVTTLPDPASIRHDGDRRTARTRRRRTAVVGIAAVALLIAATAIVLTRHGPDRVEPAPPPWPGRLAYLDGSNRISFASQDGHRQRLPATNVDRFALSPDGRQLAYITFSDSSDDRVLWISGSDGTHAAALGASCAGCMPGFGLTWSNDGTRLAYSTSTPGRRRAQLRIRTVSTGLEQVFKIPLPCEARGLRFAPDDESLVLNVACPGLEYVAVLDPEIAGSSPTRVTGGYHQVQAPSWSADGRTVYFTATTQGDNTNDTSGRGDLFRVGADGTHLRQLTHAASGERFFGVTPYDGKFLLSRARGDAAWEVGWLSGDGKTFTPLKTADGQQIRGSLPQFGP